MVKKQKREEKVEKQEISKDDVEFLRTKLSNYEQKRIQGVLVSRLEQWLIQMGVLELRDGELIVKEHSQLSHWSEVEEKRKFFDWVSAGKPKVILPPKPSNLVKSM